MLIEMISKIGFVEKLQQSSLARRLLRGAFWMGIGTIIAKGATVVASFCVARFCGKTEFGEYGMVISTASMLSTVCGMGMGTTVVKYVAELKENNPERAGRILAMATFLTWGMAIVFGLLFLILADVIADKVIAAPHLAPLLRIATLGVVLGIFNEVQLSSLTGCEAYQERAKISVFTGVLQALLLISLSRIWGLNGAVAAFSLAAIVTVVITTFLMIPIWKKYGLKRRFRGMLQEWRVLLGFSLPTILLLLLGFPVGWFTRTLLARIPNGYDHLAIINAASPWGTVIAFLITTIGTALVPVISDLVGKGNKLQALKLTHQMLKVNAFLVVPLSLMLCLFSPLILKIYGAGFETGVTAFCLVGISHGVATIYQPMWSYLVGSGYMWTNLYVVFFTAVLQVVLSWRLVNMGSSGLALSDLLTTAVRLIVLILLFKWYKSCELRRI